MKRMSAVLGRLLPVVSALLALLLFVACGKSDSVNYSIEEDAMASTQAPGAMDTGAGELTLTQPQDERKVVLTAHLTLETLDFNATCSELQQAALQSGGYISSTDIYGSAQDPNRSANFTMKIPAENYNSFIQTTENAGNLTSRSEQSEDVTDQYIDIEARLRSLRTQEARLLELMNNAVEFSDYMDIEEQLSEVQYEIESYLGRQNQLNNLIAYSTVHLRVVEVQRVTEEASSSYLSQIGHAFRESWYIFGQVLQVAGLVLVSLLPVLLLAIIVLTIVLLCVRHARKKRAARTQATAAHSQPYALPPSESTSPLAPVCAAEQHPSPAASTPSAEQPKN